MKILLQSHTQFVPTHEKKVMASKINILFASALSRINFKSSAGNRWLLHTFFIDYIPNNTHFLLLPLTIEMREKNWGKNRITPSIRVRTA